MMCPFNSTSAHRLAAIRALGGREGRGGEGGEGRGRRGGEGRGGEGKEGRGRRGGEGRGGEVDNRVRAIKMCELSMRNTIRPF